MIFERIAGEEFFPEKARAFPAAELPEHLVKFLQTHKLIPSGKRPSRVDFLKLLKIIGVWQEQQTRQKVSPHRGATARKGGAPIRSPGLLQEVRYAITDFLIDTYGARPFVPVKKKGRDQWITMGWVETNFVRTWVSVVDSDNRDVSDWNQTRVTNRDGTYTAVLAKDFYRLIRDRALVVRMWLPALGLPVLFTRDGTNPNSGAVPVRSRNRELKCFQLGALWEALRVLPTK